MERGFPKGLFTYYVRQIEGFVNPASPLCLDIASLPCYTSISDGFIIMELSENVSYPDLEQ